MHSKMGWVVILYVSLKGIGESHREGFTGGVKGTIALFFWFLNSKFCFNSVKNTFL